MSTTTTAPAPAAAPVPTDRETTPAPAVSTVTARVLARLERSDTPALLTPQSSLIGRDVAAHVRALAGELAACGIGPGHVVALLSSPNHPDVVVARHAAGHVGATVVHLRSMNPRSDEEEFCVETQLDLIDRTAARVVVADPGSTHRARELAARRTGLLVVPTTASAPAAPPVPVGAGECAVVDVTSGTTGAPRLVRQTVLGREHLVDRLADDLGHAPVRLLSVTPVTHTTAPMIDAVLLRGGSVVLHRGFDADAVLDAIEEGVTDLYLAVPHLCALLDHPRTARADLAGLRRVVYSGTPTAPHRVEAARARFGGAVVQVYGTTETGGISALTPEDHDEPLLRGTVGRPFPWVELEVRDPETGGPLPRGTAGALWVRSPTTADGYWPVPGQATPDLSPDGWVCTGDLAAVEPHGRIRLVGRLDGVIKVGGLKLYPAAIESALRELPEVSEAVVHGVRGPDRREAVHAVVVPVPGARIDEPALVRHVVQRLTPEHAPTRIVVWHGVPLTSSGKPDRRLVRELLGD